MVQQARRALRPMLLLAALLLLAAPAQAAPKTVAALGFDPAINGYGFPNYTNAGGIQNLTAVEMQRLFGAGVCLSGTGGSCMLTPEASRWMTTQNQLMADGHCEGFAVSALIFLRGLVTPQTYGATKVGELASSPALQSFIAYAYAFQSLDRVRSTVRYETPKQVVRRLILELSNRRKQFSLHIFKPDMSGGHSVTPIAVDDLGSDRYAIQIYDNNHPGKVRAIAVDAKANTWSYSASTDPSQKAALYTGDADSFTLSLEDMDPGLPVQPCPFCKTPVAAALPVLTPAVPAVLPTAPTVGATTLVNLHANSGRARHAHLSIRRTGSSGSLGYDGRDRPIKTLRGGQALFPTQGAPHYWNEAPEPQYLVPSGRALSVSLGGGIRHGSDLETLSLIGQGWHAGVAGIRATAALKARVRTAADGRSLAFATDSPQDVTPTLVLGSDQGTVAYDIRVVPHGLGKGDRVALGFDPATGTLTFTPPAAGTNTIDLRITRLRSDGTRDVFVHRDVHLLPGVPAAIDLAGWQGGGSSITIRQAGAAPLTLGNEALAPGVPPGPGPATTTPATTTTATTTTTAPASGGGGGGTPVPPSHAEAYVGNSNASSVTPIDVASSTPAAAITGITSPLAMAATPNGRTVYVSSNMGPSASTVTPIDTATNTAGTPIAVGAGPRDLVVSPDGTTLYVTDYYDDEITPIDTATNTAGTPIALAAAAPVGLAITPNGATLFVSIAGGDLLPIDTATKTVGTPITITRPYYLAMKPDGATLYVASQLGDTVTPVDVATRVVGAAITVPSSPMTALRLAVKPDGTAVYVTSPDANVVTPISTATNMAGTSIGVGTNPLGVASTPDGSSVYVTNFADNTVSVVSTSTNTVTATVSVGTGPYPIVIAQVP